MTSGEKSITRPQAAGYCRNGLGTGLNGRIGSEFNRSFFGKFTVILDKPVEEFLPYSVSFVSMKRKHKEERILLVTKKSGNRERCRKLSL